MILSGILFCADTPLNEFAKAMWMFIVQRIFLRFGIGFANQVIFSLFDPYIMWHTYVVVHMLHYALFIALTFLQV